MNITDSVNVLLQLSIVGVFLSVVLEFIKNKYGPSSLTTKFLTIGMAVALGAIVYFTFGTPIWIAGVGILAAASTFYAFFLK